MFLSENLENSESCKKNGIPHYPTPQRATVNFLTVLPDFCMHLEMYINLKKKTKSKPYSVVQFGVLLWACNMVLGKLSCIMKSYLLLGLPRALPRVLTCGVSYRCALWHDRHRRCGQAGGRPGRAHTEEHGRGCGSDHGGQPQDSQSHCHPGKGRGPGCLPHLKLQAISSWQKQFKEDR